MAAKAAGHRYNNSAARVKCPPENHGGSSHPKWADTVSLPDGRAPFLLAARRKAVQAGCHACCIIRPKIGSNTR